MVLKTAIHYFNRFDVCGQMNGVRRRRNSGNTVGAGSRGGFWPQS
ncbi:hypothetical protein [Palleniella muris]|nr:hypothetical protein [Palleniella muris]